MEENLKLLAIFPHPDDETLGMGSTLARYAAEGVGTSLICATRGERGWFDSNGPNPGLQEVGRLREVELRCAAEQLGLQEVHFLDSSMESWTRPGRRRSLPGSRSTSAGSGRRWW